MGVDRSLSILCDERQVLKSFEWPEVRYDCMREVVALTREITKMIADLTAWEGKRCYLSGDEE